MRTVREVQQISMFSFVIKTTETWRQVHQSICGGKIQWTSFSLTGSVHIQNVQICLYPVIGILGVHMAWFPAQLLCTLKGLLLHALQMSVNWNTLLSLALSFHTPTEKVVGCSRLWFCQCYSNATFAQKDDFIFLRIHSVVWWITFCRSLKQASD